MSLTSCSDSAYAVCVRTYSFTHKVPNLYPKQNQSGVEFKSVYHSNPLLCMNKHSGKIIVDHGVNYLHIYIYMSSFKTSISSTLS